MLSLLLYKEHSRLRITLYRSRAEVGRGRLGEGKRKRGVGRLWGGSGLGGSCGERGGLGKCFRGGLDGGVGADFEWGFEAGYESGLGVDFWRGFWVGFCCRWCRLGGGGLWRLDGREIGRAHV